MLIYNDSLTLTLAYSDIKNTGQLAKYHFLAGLSSLDYIFMLFRTLSSLFHGTAPPTH